MARSYACVWLDHREAKIFALAGEAVDEIDVRDHISPKHIHRKADHVGKGKSGTPGLYYGEIASALKGHRAILIVGPGTARNEFAGYLVEHEPALRSRIWGIEAMDHPTRGEIVAAARKFFRAAKRMYRETAPSV